MTICLITSFAPVRDGSAICRNRLPVGRFRPFHRSLAFAGNRVQPRKKGGIISTVKRRYPLFHRATCHIQIRQAKAGNKPTKLTDGNGLYLLVKPPGSKLWRYKYRIAGKENLFAIGEYPTVSLRDGRTARRRCLQFRNHSQFEQLINVGRCMTPASILANESRLLDGLHLVALRDVHSSPRSVASREK
ncbi:Arm DNA-binding domain-containing protein [Burkholderia sp. BCC0405]|uniref:Arm DNA-binding domain-containing protein n=1 Tax=Burkholderia sp. BCC0405 TaxID=2676298 RepID=UPI001FC8112A|nr:Arm DNA-binding domain-containing protein [Burkholderia sp. BCC0405]